MTHLLRALYALCLAATLLVGPVAAQENAAPDYEEWTELANRAEEVIDAERASDEAFEALRLSIADWRERLLDAQNENSARIATLQSQLTALGPVPEDGSESEELAQRRAELNEQLAILRAPVRRAEEAYTRADGIISEIDAIIRARQTDELLELGPSPLNPARWGPAVEDLTHSLRRSWQELQRNAASAALRAEAQNNLPLIVVLLAVALVLIARGQSWARAVVSRLQKGRRRGTGVWSFLLSLGQIILPLVGILALTEAVIATQFIGPRVAPLLERVPVWAAVLLGIRWLADQSFHASDDVATMPLAPPERKRARYYANILAILFVAKSVLDALTDADGYPVSTEATLDFPLIVLSGYALFRLGRLRNDAAVAGSAAARAAPDASLFRMRLARLFGRGAMIIGVVGPIMAAIGYARAGEALVYPAIETLALIGIVLVLQRFLNDLFHLITGRTASEAESLWPVLGGFAIVILAVPFMALIWGARVADLTEIWATFREGFQIGEARISPTDFLVVIVVFIIGYMATRLLQGGLRSSVLPKTNIDQGGQNAIVSGLGYVGIFLAAVVAITAGGLDLSSLAIVAGALSVGIGFGLQNVVNNFVSGIILLIERPISEGDWIEVGGQHGIVKDISVRSTRVETFDRYDVIIPNADLISGTVSNYTRGNVLGRIIVPVGVAYGTDTRKVERILLNIAREHDMVLMNPAPYVFFAGFGADSLDFEIRAVLRDVNQGLGVRTEMRHQIVERFAEEGIEIPFAQRDVWLRNPEVLSKYNPELKGGEDDGEDTEGDSGPEGNA
jgi:potassium efflux system protein